MKNYKNYTTIEQAKHLVEIGLNPNTHDMYYEKASDFLLEPFVWTPRLGQCSSITNNLFSYRQGYTVPCWSFGQLYDLMPEKITSTFKNKRGNVAYYLASPYKNDFCYETAESDDDLWGDTPKHLVWIENSDDKMANAIKMIEWLLENGYIEKTKNDKE